MNDERMGEHAGEVARGEDGSRHLADPVREIDLVAEAHGLREEEPWRREGHNAKTLVKNESLRIVLIDMQRGGRLREHRTRSRISIQVLAGRISVSVPGTRHEVRSGQLLAVDECIPHDVEALEPSTFLLTLAREPREGTGETQ